MEKTLVNGTKPQFLQQQPGEKPTLELFDNDTVIDKLIRIGQCSKLFTLDANSPRISCIPAVPICGTALPMQSAWGMICSLWGSCYAIEPLEFHISQNEKSR